MKAAIKPTVAVKHKNHPHQKYTPLRTKSNQSFQPGLKQIDPD